MSTEGCHSSTARTCLIYMYTICNCLKDGWISPKNNGQLLIPVFWDQTSIHRFCFLVIEARYKFGICLWYGKTSSTLDVRPL